MARLRSTRKTLKLYNKYAVREELEQVKKERESMRVALEDIADYQHRWSDSPIKEVQKIARSILSQIKV